MPELLFTYFSLSSGYDTTLPLDKVNAELTELDEVIRNELGIPVSFTKYAKDPKYKGFLATWVLRSIEVKW